MPGKTKQPTLLSGVLLLSIATLGVKVIGLVFKIPLSYLLGDEGMGYFNAAYTIYSWLYILSSAGLPVAVSMLVSEARERGDYCGVQRIFRVAMFSFFCIGTVAFAMMYLFSGNLARLIGNADSRYAMAAISPTLFFICLVGGVRGYFQGQKRMLPTALSQILEALGKLALGMLFATYAAKTGKPLPAVAGYAILGVTLGTAISAGYLLLSALIDRKRMRREEAERPEQTEKKTVSRLLRIALPITLSSAVMNFTNLIDLGFIMNRLGKAGYSESAAAALFGNYTTLAVPMFNLPTVLIYPVACSVVPYIAAELALGNKDGASRFMSAALRITSILSVPSAFVLGFFGKRILLLFFRRESAEMAAPLLAVLAPAVFFLGVVTVTNAILQANGLAGRTVLSMGIGAVIKTVTGFLLIGNPSFGIFGAAIGTLLCYATASVINLISLTSRIRLGSGLLSVFAYPTVSAGFALLPSMLLLRFLIPYLPMRLGTVFLLLFFALLYFLFLFLFGVIREEDIRGIPLGGKIILVLRRVRLLH